VSTLKVIERRSHFNQWVVHFKNFLKKLVKKIFHENYPQLSMDFDELKASFSRKIYIVTGQNLELSA